MFPVFAPCYGISCNNLVMFGMALFLVIFTTSVIAFCLSTVSSPGYRSRCCSLCAGRSFHRSMSGEDECPPVLVIPMWLDPSRVLLVWFDSLHGDVFYYYILLLCLIF